MTFDAPALLLAIPALAALVVLCEIRLPASRARRCARAASRVLVLSLLVAAAAGPVATGAEAPSRRLVVATDHAALGRADALGPAAREEAAAIADRAAREAVTAGAAATLLAFGERGVEADDGPHARGSLAAGLATAHLAFRAGETGAVLVVTDGHGDATGAAEAAARLAADGIRVHARVVPRGAPAHPPAPAVTALDAPDRVSGPFDLTATVTGGGALRLELLVNGRAVAERRAEGTGERSMRFEDVSLPPGAHEVAVRAEDEAGSPPALVRRLVEVDEPPSVWAIIENPVGSPVRRALSAQGFRVAAAPAEALAALFAGDVERPDAIVLDAASAVALPESVERALTDLVEGGLGLYLEAGDSEEAWTALADRPLARLLPLVPRPPLPTPPPDPTPPPPPAPLPSVEPPKPEPGPGLAAERRPEEALRIALLLVLDRSGSMQGMRLAMAVEGARRAASTLAPSDRVGIVTFAEDATVDVPFLPAGEVGDLAWRLAYLQAAGNTDIYAALRRAAQALAEEPAPIRHLILLTDGRQTMTVALFGPLMRRLAAAGITVTAVGIGRGHDEVLLKTIVQYGPGGRYVPVDSAEQIPTILTRDTQRVAEDRRREVEARGLIQDPRRTAEPPRPEDPPPAPPPDELPPDPTLPPPPAGPSAVPLVRLRPHEATRGVGEQALPSVGSPRPADVAPGAALLLAREDGAPVLGARRFGLGRVLVWALPPEAEGLAAWPEHERVHVQGVRSVMAPEGSERLGAAARVLRTPDGERLRLEADPADGPTSVRVRWHGPGGMRDLGAVAVPTADDLPLPVAPAGAVATLVFEAGPGGPRLPPLTYLAMQGHSASPRPGDVDALARALGGALAPADAALLPPARPRPTRRPLWYWFLAAAALALPFDVLLHRPRLRA